mmetsp:Transcript_23642/g.3926  ORF Transcript_23642/g.3926 Transcript_23642/m.3926 type:complete len:95 (-) Transcript_23642:15-299(-)
MKSAQKSPELPFLQRITQNLHFWAESLKSVKSTGNRLSLSRNFTDHDWLDEDTIIAVSDMSEAFIAKNGELVKKVEFAMGGEFVISMNKRIYLY